MDSDGSMNGMSSYMDLFRTLEDDIEITPQQIMDSGKDRSYSKNLAYMQSLVQKIMKSRCMKAWCLNQLVRQMFAFKALRIQKSSICFRPSKICHDNPTHPNGDAITAKGLTIEKSTMMDSAVFQIEC